MSKGYKIWLWILMIGGGISVLTGLTAMSYSGGMGLFSVAMGIMQLAGVSILLFKRKKEGFYIICAMAVINFIFNITHHVNFLFALLALVAMPGITYFFIWKQESIDMPLVNSSKSMDTAEMRNTKATTNTGDNKTEAASASQESEKQTSDSFTTTYQQTETNSSDATYQQVETNSSATTHQQEAKATGAANKYFQSFTNKTDKKESAKNKTKSSAEEKAAMFGATKNIDVSVDLYKELEIDRSWDEKSIRNHLKGLQKLWTQRQGATNDKEQLLLIDKILKLIEDGYRFLTKAIKRQQYDQALELAYKAGKIIDDVEEKLLTLLDQARAYYRKGNIKLATKCAEEAIEGNINDASAYDLLARCYFDTETYDKAIAIVDQGISIFNGNINLHWLGARIAIIGTQNFENAQQRINTLINIAPDNSIGHSEQVYLDLRKGEEQLAFQEIDSYIKKHPADETFKKDVAYDLDAYSNACYYYDAAQNASFIADKKAYEKCLFLRKKAVEIFDDEHTRDRLENAQYYGRKEWNDWNMPAIKSLALYGTIFAVLGLAANDLFVVALILYAIMGVLIYFSFRPYWQINKSYITGQMGTLEKIVNKVGELSAKVAVLTLQIMIKTIGAMLKFAFDLASGKWF